MTFKIRDNNRLVRIDSYQHLLDYHKSRRRPGREGPTFFWMYIENMFSYWTYKQLMYNSGAPQLEEALNKIAPVV